ncbi:MAG: hypothetical protein U5L96_05900 [Owenweeksia sp.]|nr:hypothetical protein [Owenweeksia sp.]
MRVKLFIKLTLVIAVTSACAINKKAFHASEDMAVISYNTMDQIKNNSSLQARVITDALMDTTIVDPPKKIKDHFMALNEVLLSKVVNEEQIIELEQFQEYATENANNYKNFDKIVNLGVTYASPEGYPVLKPGIKKTIMESFEYLPKNIDAVIVVSNTFSLEQVATFEVGGVSTAGLGKQAVRSDLTVQMVNRNGKKILYKTFLGISEGKLSSRENEFTLDQLAEQALDESFSELNEFLIKESWEELKLTA